MWLVGQFCERIGRDHKSNGVKMTVDLSARVVYQTCWCVRATHASVTLQYPHTDGLRSLCCFVVVVVNFTFIILLVCLPACLPACVAFVCWRRDPDCRGYQSPAVPIPSEALTEAEACRLTGLPPPPPPVTSEVLVLLRAERKRWRFSFLPNDIFLSRKDRTIACQDRLGTSTHGISTKKEGRSLVRRSCGRMRG